VHRRLVLPAHLARGPFTVAEGLAAGLSAGDLRSAVLHVPFSGVRVPRALPPSTLLTCRAASLVLPAHAAFDGATAIALRRLPLPRGVDPTSPVVVRVPPGTSVPRIGGIRARVGRRPPGAVGTPGRLAVVHPLEAWAALATTPQVPVDELVVVGDAVVRRTGLEALHRTVRAYAGRAGSRRMRQAAALVRERVDSPQETRTRLLLVHAGVPEPEVNRAVHADDGSGWLFRPDMRWLEVKVALEYDGRDHEIDDDRRSRDNARRVEAEQHGWRVVVAVSADLTRGRAAFLRRVEDVLRGRGLRW
jgi:hypothetical protein